MRWAEGFIAADWGTTNRRAYLIDADGQMRRRVRGRQGHLVGRERAGSKEPLPRFASGWATGRCCLPAWSDRTADGSKRPMCPAPPVFEDLAASAGLARGRPHRDRSRRFLRRSRRGGRHARRGSAAARRACRRPDPRRCARLPSRHAQQMGAAGRRQDRPLHDGDDRRDFQPAARAQHSRRPAVRTRRARRGVCSGRSPWSFRTTA